MSENMSVMRSFGLAVVLVVGFVAFSACSSTDPDPVEEDLAILFIGNSLTYTNDLPAILRDLLRGSETTTVFVESIAHPNYGLEDHWSRPEARERIAELPWDYVIMQQGPSATEGRPSLIEYSKLFGEEIRDAGAIPALYMVWPEQARLGDFAGVRDSYRAAADSVNGLFFPGGAAWQEYWIRGDTPLYGPDGFHPSPEGTYLAAVVMWEQITGRNPTELDLKSGTRYGSVSVPYGLGETLHASAHAANLKYARELD